MSDLATGNKITLHLALIVIFHFTPNIIVNIYNVI